MKIKQNFFFSFMNIAWPANLNLYYLITAGINCYTEKQVFKYCTQYDSTTAIATTTTLYFFFDVLLTVHLSIFISVFNQLYAQNLFHNKFYFMPLHVLSTFAHHQEVKIALHSLWCLFHACTCFEHMCLSSACQNCITQPLVFFHVFTCFEHWDKFTVFW